MWGIIILILFGSLIFKQWYLVWIYVIGYLIIRAANRRSKDSLEKIKDAKTEEDNTNL